MRLVRSLALAGFALCLLAGTARAQEPDREKLREELLERLDARLEKLREEMIREIDRALEGRRARPDRVRPDRPDRRPPQPAGERPFLGVTLKPLSDGARTLLGVPEGIGVMIEDIQPGSPANEAGLVAGDVLLQFDGKDITGPEGLGRLVGAAKVGQKIELSILHRGKKRQVTVQLAGRKVEGAAPVPVPERPDRPARRDDESLEEFLERVLKDRQARREGGPGEGGRPEGPFGGFGGDPEQMQKMMEQFFGGDPEQQKKMMEDAQKMMEQLFGGDPEGQQKMMEQAQKMMEQLFGGEGGEGGQDLQKMLERMMGGQGPRPGGEGEPQEREGADRLNKLLDDVLKRSQGTEKKDEGKTPATGKAFLGLSLRPVSPAVRTQMNVEEGVGLLVAGVLEDGPAAAGGIERFDILVAIDGKKIGSVEDLAAALAQHEAGDEVAVSLVRKGTKVEKKVTLGEPR